MKRLDRLRIPDEWGVAILDRVHARKPVRRHSRWPFYLLVTVLTILIIAGALEQYFN